MFRINSETAYAALQGMIIGIIGGPLGGIIGGIVGTFIVGGLFGILNGYHIDRVLIEGIFVSFFAVFYGVIIGAVVGAIIGVLAGGIRTDSVWIAIGGISTGLVIGWGMNLDPIAIGVVVIGIVIGGFASGLVTWLIWIMKGRKEQDITASKMLIYYLLAVALIAILLPQVLDIVGAPVLDESFGDL